MIAGSAAPVVFRRIVVAAAAVALAAAPQLAAADVPVRVRIVKGSRQTPPKFDARLSDLKKQLSRLSYSQWEQVAEQDLSMAPGKTDFVTLPNGEHVGLTVLEVRGDTVTFEVAMATQNTQSRLTIDKNQRIVHQVTREKKGVAYFISARAWP